MAARTQPIDWVKAKEDYQAGIMTVRAVARKHGCSHKNILERAVKEGWGQNLHDRVQGEIREQVLGPDAPPLTPSDPNQSSRARTEEEIVTEAANMQVAVILKQRKDIQQVQGAFRTIVTRLVDHLDGRTSNLPFMGAKESPADVLEKATRSLERLNRMEGEAFRLNDRPTESGIDAEEVKEALQGLSDEQLAELGRSIVEGAPEGNPPRG